MLTKAETFQEIEPSYHLENGLEYWFAPKGAPASPQLWKMVIVTVLGVWPLSMLVPWLLAPLIADFSAYVQALLVAVGIVVLLTWAVMPALVRILKPWLQPRS